MAIRSILRYPDPRLHTKAAVVQELTPDVGALIEDMFDTMYAANGIGLAATQVDAHVRVVVVDLSPERNQPQVFINPEIVETQGAAELGEEGCLSLPGIREQVARVPSVTVSYMDQQGARKELLATGLLGRCLLHEMDHLNGKVFVQHLSPLKQQRAKTKLQKWAKRDVQRA